MKDFNDAIWNRTSDLAICGAVPTWAPLPGTDLSQNEKRGTSEVGNLSVPTTTANASFLLHFTSDPAVGFSQSIESSLSVNCSVYLPSLKHTVSWKRRYF